MLDTLRQRRYLGLFAAMCVIAAICTLAGTWQISRYDWKHRANHELRANNGENATTVTGALGPAAAPSAQAADQRFRHLTATGNYLPTNQVLVRGQSVNSDVGYLVLTPFRTADGILLVVRGFEAQTGSAIATPTVAAPPTGTVTLTGRLQTADTKTDKFGRLPADQVESINPVEQSARLGQPVWNAYVELLDGQPGTSGLTVIPAPDLSNPAGGADEPQHLAYVLQWYLFAVLALALPFVLARAERRRDAVSPADATAADPTDPSEKPAPPLTRKQKRATLDDRLAGRT